MIYSRQQGLSVCRVERKQSDRLENTRVRLVIQVRQLEGVIPLVDIVQFLLGKHCRCFHLTFDSEAAGLMLSTRTTEQN